MKKKISSSQKQFLEKELLYLKSKGVHVEHGHLDDYYEIEEKQRQSTVQTLLWVGALLVGVGFLSFVASNWSYLSSVTKFLVIFFGVIGFYVAGWTTEKNLPKTSRSLYYLGGFLFGSGIFLIGQAFHLGGEVYPAFLFWAIGIIPLAFYLKDKAVLNFSILLLLLYSSEIYMQDQYPFVLLMAIPLIYLINHMQLNKSKSVFFINSILLIHFLHSQLWFFGVNHFITVMLLFLLGIVISWKSNHEYTRIMKLFGYIVQGVYGIALTVPSVWEFVFSASVSQSLAIIFAIVYGLYIIFMVRQANLMAIMVLCGLIFRFYIDLSYDFLPKSLFFIIGGAILILFGFWFERRLRGDGGAHENKPI